MLRAVKAVRILRRIVRVGEEIESGEEIVKSGEEIEESGEEIEGGKVEVEGIEVDEVESPGAHVQPDTINSAGLVGSDGSGPAGPAGPAGSAGPAGPASIAGYPGAATSFVPAISILPPTPVKNKGKGKETPDDNQEDIFLADLHLDSLMVHNDESGRLKHGRERSGTGDVRGSKTHRRSASHSTEPTVPSTEEDDDDDDDDDDDVEDLDEIDLKGS